MPKSTVEFINTVRRAIPLFLVFLFAGCQSMHGVRGNEPLIKSPPKMASFPTKDQKGKRSRSHRPLLIPGVVGSSARLVLTPPDPLDKPVTVNARRMPVSEVIDLLAAQGNVQVDVRGSLDKKITLFLKSVPLRVALQKITEQAGLIYTYRNGILTIDVDRPVWKPYEVDLVNIKKSVKGTISLNMSVGSSVAGQDQGGASGAASGPNTSEVQLESVQNPWQEIEDNLKAILGLEDAQQSGGGADRVQVVSPEQLNALSINKQAGLIMVYAPSRLQKKVAAYLKRVKKRAKRQVLIQAMVVEVQLSDAHQAGIDWSSFQVTNGTANQLSNTYPIHIVTVNNKLSQLFNMNLGIKLLQKFGKTKVISQPKIVALNNQSAILKVVDNQVYFTTSVSTDSNQSTTTTTFQTQVHTVPVGFMMTVTPFVTDDDHIELYVRPNISRILGYVADPHPELARAGVKSQIPIIQEREISTTLELKNGETVAIGGLMQSENSDSSNGLPGIADVPGVGALFKSVDNSSTRSELVIFLRPVLVE